MIKSILFVLLFSLLFAACLKEEKVDIAKPDTFIRYYNDGYNNVGVTVEQTKDKGYIILANATNQNTDAETPQNNIMVMKTDAYGNLLWRRYYPNEFATGTDNLGYVANSISFLPDSSGYLVVGYSINVVAQKQQTSVLAFTIDDIDGDYKKGPKELPVVNRVGKAGVAKGDGNYLIMASVSEPTDTLIVGELDSDLNFLWTRKHAQGVTSLSNRIFYQPAQGANTARVFWGGNSIQSGSKSDLFLTQSELNSPGTITGSSIGIGSAAFDDFATDFCQFGGQYAFTGRSEERGGDIIIYTATSNGSADDLFTYNTEIFEGTIPDGGNTQFETGNSITSTYDGGLIVLGTVETYPGGALGRGDTDMILLKVNGLGLGEKQWSKTYGSKDADAGNCIRQTRDRGYIVLGTTRLGGLRTVTLIKTDNNGNINPE